MHIRAYPAIRRVAMAEVSRRTAMRLMLVLSPPAFIAGWGTAALIHGWVL